MLNSSYLLTVYALLDHDDFTGGDVAGLVVGLLVFFIIVVCLTACCVRRRRRARLVRETLISKYDILINLGVRPTVMEVNIYNW